MLKEFRTLRPDEILVRVERVNPQTLLGEIVLYKDARCDMRILDETVGPGRWQTEHVILDGQNYCKLSIWDEELKQWVSQMDVGVAQRFEREKSAASDALKRAAFRFGLGRELYTKPEDARVQLRRDEVKTGNDGNTYMKDEIALYVGSISYENKQITQLTVIDATGKPRYIFPAQNAAQPGATAQNTRGKAQAGPAAPIQAPVPPAAPAPAYQRKNA